MSKSPASSRASARARRSEAGDTLIEVLLAIVILGLASVALMLAFTTDISSSGEHRSLTTVDILLKSYTESAISQIEQNYQSCATASTYSSTGADPVSFTMPSGDSAYTVGIDTAVPVAYWNGSTFSSTGCSAGSTASQEITAMASGPYSTTDTLTFVVNDPLAPAPPVYGTATQLVFLNSPSNSATGAVFATQPVVAVEDQNGNIVTSDFSDISLTITQTGATVPNCVVVPNYGVDSFTGCSISQAGSYTLTATDNQEDNLTTGLALTGTSGTFTVGAAASNYFSVAYPGPQTAGVPFTDTITATDANGNILTTYTGNHTITFSGPANSPNATAPTYFEPVTFVSGVATIGMTLVDAQTTTLTATDSTGITGTSASFAVQTAPADATQSTVSASPTAVTANGVSSSTVTVTLEDAYGNPVSGDTVTLAQSNGAVSSNLGTEWSFQLHRYGHVHRHRHVRRGRHLQGHRQFGQRHRDAGRHRDVLRRPHRGLDQPQRRPSRRRDHGHHHGDRVCQQRHYRLVREQSCQQCHSGVRLVDHRRLTGSECRDGGCHRDDTGRYQRDLFG
jgi:type II secretory pathway pseudopilin PulG